MEKSKHYILQIYLEHSFTRAAAKLFITQPALSAIVKKEEDQLGCKIFDRTKKPFTLTPAGQLYIQTALQIQTLEQQLHSQLSQLATCHNTTITIGSAAFFCANILPSLAEAFQKRHPHCTVTLTEGNTQELQAQLEEGKTDLVISVDAYDSTKYLSLPLKKEQLLLAVPAALLKDSPLQTAALTTQALQDQAFLSPACPAVPLKNFARIPFILLKPGNDSYQRALKMFQNSGFTPQVTMYIDQLQTAYFIAKDGKGATFIRSDLLKYIDATPKLLYYKIADPLATRSVNLIYRKHPEPTELLQLCIDYCLRQLR